MHDLMRDLARNVAAKEFLTLTACTKDLEGKVRHLYIGSNKVLTTWFHSRNCPTKTLRTCMKYSVSTTSDAIISNCSCVRVLDMWDSVCIRNLPDKLGKLSHLRYLDLSNFYDLEMLPKSITKLHNLQTLRLRSCSKLKELPEDTSKLVNLRMLDMHGCRSLTHMPEDISKLVNLRVLVLSECESLTHMPAGMGELLQLSLKELPEDTCKLVNLRVLDMKGCNSFTHMPAGMGKLTCLHTLPTFLLSKDDDKKGKLRDLAALISNLSGDLDVKDYKYEGYLISSTVLHVKLRSLKLSCKLKSSHPFKETLMESLFCNHQFQHLEMEYYGGTKLPSFALGLVRIDLRKCDRLQHLPSSLSQLCHLKKLCLRYMQNLEYIDSNAPSSSTNFFPALEKL
ncbi:probable disease resistance protein At5g66900 [Chenopodium quinoa]|uniref:probable disease resistance protein At5g66900 n=1 Tax=Chenopodium quinoa TaxID=63459 RepID=UPI000B78DAEC|nr:probable disease resistance protein At5g66900 [Chenopodium quinoa]